MFHVQRLMFIALAVIPAAMGCRVSQKKERELGAADAAQVDSQLPLVHDSLIDQFVNRLGNSMASHTNRADLDWRFAVVNSPEVNAFALPGGFIYVNRGTIEQADRLDELAGVMGHEIGHVVRRHSVKQMQQGKKEEVGLVMLCTLTRVCRTIGGQVVVGVGVKARSAHYSQRDEAEADSEAVLITRAAGIDPEGLPSFFQKLLVKRTEQPTALEAFFSTHPTDQSRVDATRREISDQSPPRGQVFVRDSPEFHAFQEHVRALPLAPQNAPKP